MSECIVLQTDISSGTSAHRAVMSVLRVFGTTTAVMVSALPISPVWQEDATTMATCALVPLDISVCKILPRIVVLRLILVGQRHVQSSLIQASEPQGYAVAILLSADSFNHILLEEE